MIEITTLGAVIKQTYEGQPNTNPFTNAEKQKLANLANIAVSGSFADLNNVPSLVVLDDDGLVPTEHLSGPWTDVVYNASTYQNTNSASGTFGTVQWRISNGMVQLRGLMTGYGLTGANLVQAFTLPAEARPSKQRLIVLGCEGMTAEGSIRRVRIDIRPDGTATVEGANTGMSYVSFDGSSFSL